MDPRRRPHAPSMFDSPTLQSAPSLPSTLPSQPDLLIIGYGSVLHGDDGVGPWMADLVAGLDWPGVRCLALTQLTPDLAAELAAAKAVVFVDASVQVAAGQIQVGSLSPRAPQTFDSHQCTPQSLLWLAHELYGQSPRNWMISVGAFDFGLGRPLSPAIAGMREVILGEIQVLRTWAADEA